MGARAAADRRPPRPPSLPLTSVPAAPCSISPTSASDSPATGTPPTATRPSPARTPARAAGPPRAGATTVTPSPPPFSYAISTPTPTTDPARVPSSEDARAGSRWRVKGSPRRAKSLRMAAYVSARLSILSPFKNFSRTRNQETPLKALSTYARSTARQASRKSRFSAVTAAAGGAGAASQAAAATAVVAVPRSRVDRDGCSGGGGQSPGGGLEGRGEAKVGATRGSALPRRRLARRPPRLPHAHPAGSETDRTTDGPRGGARPRAAGGRGRIREGATGERAVGTV